MSTEFHQIPFADPGYMISRDGKFRSPRKDFILRSEGDYIGVNIRVNGNHSCFPLHRVVALTFIPNPENKPLVNHINRQRWDCRVDNLEWATHSENTKHWHMDNFNKQFKFQPGVRVLIPRIEKTGIVTTYMGRYIDVAIDNEPNNIDIFIYTELEILE